MQSDKLLEYVKHIKIHLWSGWGPVPGGLTNYFSQTIFFSLFCYLSFLKVYFVNEYFKQWPWMHSNLSKLVDRNSPSLSLLSPPPELCLIIINAIIRTHTIHYCLSISFFSLRLSMSGPLSPHIDVAWEKSTCHCVCLTNVAFVAFRFYRVLFCHSTEI